MIADACQLRFGWRREHLRYEREGKALQLIVKQKALLTSLDLKLSRLMSSSIPHCGLHRR